MKIRSGFVSNSSSSSFVVIAPKNIVDKVLDKMTTNEKAAINWVKTEEKVFIGKSVCVFSGVEGNYSSWDNFDFPEDNEDDEDDDLSVYDVFSDFRERLKETSSDVIEIESDF